MKLIVSVMPRSLEEAQALDATRYLDADIIEWRADYLPKEAILQVAPAIFEKFAGRELVFTLRTRSEGGEIDLSPEEYIHLIKEVAQFYQPDYIDFEYYSYKDVFEEMLDFPNLVLSYHNFQETPENMMEILSELTILNPKLVKVAVMAHTEQDVLDLMNYTRGFKTLNPEQEYVTISMGKVGKVSRITADVTGSSWSFASLDEVSAPGQISLASMKKIREILDEARWLYTFSCSCCQSY
ncbi:TPA: type I 3-dehydroquinate dehydratase [Streptococcus pneumoniae]|nr:type I 3-dehydroquinate dehydratase [Streptococcus pneumoniae]